MITKAELIRKLAKRAGVPDSELKVFFEIYLKKLSEILSSGDAAVIEGLGYFHSVKGEIRKSTFLETEDDNEVVYLDLLLFSDDKTYNTESNENLLFSIPTIKSEDYNPIDSYLSLSIGKPVIPLKGTKDTEFFIPLSGLELKRLVESKVDKAISHLKILAHNTTGNNIISIDTEVYNPNQFEFNWSNESEEENETVITDAAKSETTSNFTKNFDDITWNFGEKLAKQIEEESILDFEKPEEEFSGEGLSWDFGPLYLEDENKSKNVIEETSKENQSEENQDENNETIELHDENESVEIETENISDKIENEIESNNVFEDYPDESGEIQDEEETDFDENFEQPELNETEPINLKSKHGNFEDEITEPIDNIEDEIKEFDEELNNNVEDEETNELDEVEDDNNYPEDNELIVEENKPEFSDTDENIVSDQEEPVEDIDESIDFDFSKKFEDNDLLNDTEELKETEEELNLDNLRDKIDSGESDLEINDKFNLDEEEEKTELNQVDDSIFNDIDLEKDEDLDFDKITEEDEDNLQDQKKETEKEEEEVGNYKRVKSIFSKFESSKDDIEVGNGFDLINEIPDKTAEGEPEKTKDGYLKVKSKSSTLKLEPIKNPENVNSAIPELNDDYFIRHTDDEEEMDKSSFGKGVKFKDRTYKKKNRSSALGFIIAAVVLILIIAGIYLVLRLTQNEKANNQSELPVNVSASSFSEIIKRNFDIPVIYPYPKDQKVQNDFNPISADLLKNEEVNNVTEGIKTNEKIPEQKLETAKPKTEIKTSSGNVSTVNNDLDRTSKFVGNNIYKYGDVYVLQVSSWPTKEKAMEQSDKYNSGSISAFIEKAEIPGRGTWYRVRVGNFNSYEEALNYKNNLK